MNYYNEIDPKACAWLRALISEGLIPVGDVDQRSIIEVKPADLEGYDQCHFFAGIGGWSLALRLAEWPSERQIWTASCPCQPLSCAGLGKGHADERHLWPALYRLIAARKPATIVGEQVSSKDGREWFSGVRADLEGMGYAVGGADLCSAGVGAPNIRQRLYWVAESIASRERRGRILRSGKSNGKTEIWASEEFTGHSANGGLADTNGSGSQPREQTAAAMGHGSSADSTNFWSDSIWHLCRDGKHRRIPVEPAFFPLSPRLPGRVAALRGYGNAINPEVAAAFIRAYKESC